jgi:hypothetical protein
MGGSGIFHKRLLCLIATLAVVVPAALADEPTGFVRHYTWHNSETGEGVPGLFAFESATAGTVSRLYVQAPSGQRLVLGVFLDPISGHWHNTIMDDETGVVIELDKDIGVTASSLREFFAKTHDLTSDSVTAEHATISRGSASAKVTIPVLPGWPRGHCRDAVNDIDNGVRDRLVKGLSPGFKRSLRFAEAFVGGDSPTGEGGEFLCVVNILAELTKGNERIDIGHWTQEVDQPHKDLTAADTAFLGRFRSVTDKRKPLSGHHVEEEARKK